MPCRMRHAMMKVRGKSAKSTLRPACDTRERTTTRDTAAFLCLRLLIPRWSLGKCRHKNHADVTCGSGLWTAQDTTTQAARASSGGKSRRPHSWTVNRFTHNISPSSPSLLAPWRAPSSGSPRREGRPSRVAPRLLVEVGRSTTSLGARGRRACCGRTPTVSSRRPRSCRRADTCE